MRRLPPLIGAALISGAVLLSTQASGGLSSTLFAGTADAQSVGSGPCSLNNRAALCDTFDQPAGIGNRSGQLNGTLWGVSRTTQNNNLGQGIYNAWSPTQLVTCSGTPSVQPPNDIVICNGRMREATYDGSANVTTLAMYPKQPFDFAGRTGIATFDVSNDTQGNHGAWPEFWMTDQPVPAPFAHEATSITVPRNGFGIRFAAMAVPGQGAIIAPGCPNDGNTRWTVDSAIISRNHVADDSFNGGAVAVTPLDCVIASSGPNGGLNHVEIHVSQTQLDVYATDAGTTGPLHHLAVIQNANLTFTRGLIWIEDVHYNGNKFGNQGTHTFTWDNVGFDGPVLARDLAYDVPDQLEPAGAGTLNLGWLEAPNVPQPKTVTGVTNVSSAAAALLTFSVYHYTPPAQISYVVNGHSHTQAWPFTDNLGYTVHTLAVPVPVSEVLTGTNSISVAADQQVVISNLDLVLAGAGGGGSTSLPPPSLTPTASATAVKPVSTITPTATATSMSVGGFILVGGASPATTTRGSTVMIGARITSQTNSQILVDIEVVSSAGVRVFQQFFDKQAFTAGESKTFGAPWAIPANAAATTYMVKVGAFSPGWGTLYSWNDTAMQFVVR